MKLSQMIECNKELNRTLQHRVSKIELQSELDQPWIVARRGDATEISRVASDLASRRIERCRRDGVEVADRICEIDVIEEVEELGAEFDVL